MTLESEIDAAVGQHERALSDIWKLIRRIQRDSDISEVERHRFLGELFAPLSVKDIRQNFVMDSIQHDLGVSFRSNMAVMMRLKKRMRKHGYNIAPGNNDKNRDLSFAAKLGIAVPRTLQHGVGTSGVSIMPSTIIKPTEGANSRGVFYVGDDRELRSIRTGRTYLNLLEAAQEVRQNTESLRWSVEEAVIGPDGGLARDFKAYMFYGVAGLYLEIDRSADGSGKRLYAGYTGDGGRRDISPNHHPMEGTGLPLDILEKARRVSLNSPTPFLRVDFLVGRDECYLGEVTPHPGNTYAGDLYEDIDRALGDLFLDAEARLLIDLFGGKQFELYHDCYATTDTDAG